LPGCDIWQYLCLVTCLIWGMLVLPIWPTPAITGPTGPELPFSYYPNFTYVQISPGSKVEFKRVILLYFFTLLNKNL
jgi:hypothetical protein